MRESPAPAVSQSKRRRVNRSKPVPSEAHAEKREKWVCGPSWNKGFGGIRNLEKGEERIWQTHEDQLAMQELHHDIHVGLEWTSMLFKYVRMNSTTRYVWNV